MLINFQTFFTVTPGVLIKKANIKKEKKNQISRYTDSSVNFIPGDFFCHLT